MGGNRVGYSIYMLPKPEIGGAPTSDPEKSGTYMAGWGIGFLFDFFLINKFR